ncbi:glycosyltransferase [Ancylobacter sp. FA202]|uniref:glycosyltransferase n=1 Tax=Ancylobacter sp. FA202 TaxID=1111106 RepID=UPI0003636C7F|nr:glycosyltransferase [Ancylobacter sp. FA202]
MRSIANLVEHLADEFHFHILTSDRDLGDVAAYADMETDRWVPVGRAQVYYASPARQGPLALARLIRQTPHDLLYINSFFSPRFSIAPLVARRLGLVPSRPTVLAPRGEFSVGALALKTAKKRAYLRASRAAGLFAGLRWQASTPFEASDIRAVMGPEMDVAVACDLSEPILGPPPVHPPRAPGQPLRVVFLSRVSPKKNLDFALTVLASVRCEVDFVIYGPLEDADYALFCRELAESLPAHVTVRWAGPVHPDEVPAVFAAHDLFFFPTRGENFGHVIAEALAAGTPVLLSDATPWRALAVAGVGDDLPLGAPGAFAAFIEAMAVEPTEAALARRARAAAFVRRRQREGNDVADSRNLFLSALASRSVMA